MNRKNCSVLSRVPCALYLIGFALCLASCNTIDLYERSVSIPGHSWKSSFKPSFTFTIKDTTSAYELFLILRHNDKYNFNNIYINVYAQTPDADTAEVIRRDLLLGTDEKGWLGTGMDDIYERRVSLTESQALHFRRSGTYTFSIEQIMREDPLNNVLNVGLRIEKKK